MRATSPAPPCSPPRRHLRVQRGVYHPVFANGSPSVEGGGVRVRAASYNRTENPRTRRKRVVSSELYFFYPLTVLLAPPPKPPTRVRNLCANNFFDLYACKIRHVCARHSIPPVEPFPGRDNTDDCQLFLKRLLSSFLCGYRR